MNEADKLKQKIQTHVADMKAQIADAHSKASKDIILRHVKQYNLDFTDFDSKKSAPAIIERLLGKYKNRIVSGEEMGGINYRYGVLVGALGTTKNDIIGVLYNPLNRDVYIVSPITIKVEDALDKSIINDVYELLLTQGYKSIAAESVTLAGVSSYCETLLIPGSTSKYQVFLNFIESENVNTKQSNCYFFIGVQLKSSTYTQQILRDLQYCGLTDGTLVFRNERHIDDLKNLINRLPAQISITPLISMSTFLNKFHYDDLLDGNKIMKYYAFDMLFNNYTGLPVSSVTTKGKLFSTIEHLRDALSKSQAAEAFAAENAARVDFEFYKTKLLNFICAQGFEIVNANGIVLVFFDNEIYNAIVNSVLRPTSIQAGREPGQRQFLIHKLILSYMCIPPFFIDLDQFILLPADSYSNYLKISSAMGSPGKAEEMVHERNQREWAHLNAALERMGQYKDLSPEAISIIINLALL